MNILHILWCICVVIATISMAFIYKGHDFRRELIASTSMMVIIMFIIKLTQGT